MFWRKQSSPPPLTNTILAHADLCGESFYVNFQAGGCDHYVNFVNSHSHKRIQMVLFPRGDWRVRDISGFPTAAMLMAATDWCKENYR